MYMRVHVESFYASASAWIVVGVTHAKSPVTDRHAHRCTTEEGKTVPATATSMQPTPPSHCSCRKRCLDRRAQGPAVRCQRAAGKLPPAAHVLQHSRCACELGTYRLTEQWEQRPEPRQQTVALQEAAHGRGEEIGACVARPCRPAGLCCPGGDVAHAVVLGKGRRARNGLGARGGGTTRDHHQGSATGQQRPPAGGDDHVGPVRSMGSEGAGTSRCYRS
jgi:hypothetical protein